MEYIFFCEFGEIALTYLGLQNILKIYYKAVFQTIIIFVNFALVLFLSVQARAFKSELVKRIVLVLIFLQQHISYIMSDSVRKTL